MRYDGGTPDMEVAESPRDMELREAMQAQLAEAAERATFHRVEAERWERIGRAAGAGLVQLDSAEPVGQVTTDDLVERGAFPAAGKAMKLQGQVTSPGRDYQSQ